MLKRAGFAGYPDLQEIIMIEEISNKVQNSHN